MAATDTKLSSNSRKFAVPKHGRGKLVRDGAPGHRGAGGRPPFHIKNLCQKISEQPEFATALGKNACDPDHKHWPAATKSVLAYGWGLPEQAVIHSGTSERILKVMYEQLPPLPDRHDLPVAAVRVIEPRA